ncbi:MAG: trimethylamine methyltransferase family protein [Deferrisomatales bacterium]
MKRFEYFDDDQVGRVHEATLRVLERVGVDFHYPPALEVLRKAGCRVEGVRVFFPPRLVEEQVAKAPGEFTLRGRDPDKSVPIGGDHIAFAGPYGAPFVADLDRGRRPAPLEDYVRIVQLIQASRYLDVVSYDAVEPNDLPEDQRNARMICAALRYSDKPFMGGTLGEAAARETLQLASLVFGSPEELAANPPFLSILCSRTPLGFDDKMTGAIMEYARAGMPQLISSLAIAGATAPCSLAGTLVVQNAEILAGIVLTQLVREGTPVVFSGSSSNAAMRFGTLSVGSPEMAINAAATAQMARFYGVPSRAGGAVTDAKVPDAQAAGESMQSQLMATLAGAHFVLHSAGILDGYLVTSYEKLVLDDQICGMCKRIRAGYERLDEPFDEQLAVDLIASVGPGGEYLTQAHTYERFRQEFFAPPMDASGPYDHWLSEGALPMEQRANRRWKELLADYEEPRLPPSVEKDLQAYLDAL